ncbi:MAG: GlsB/YeaQ/YmgE family stress response membrane protein [Thermodesulfobacteriota bacterium]
MEIISWIIFGLVAGAVAKMLMPGKDPGGFIGTIAIGVVGAFVGGLIASMPMFGGTQVQPGFNLKSFLFAVAGSIILLAVYRLVKGKA